MLSTHSALNWASSPSTFRWAKWNLWITLIWMCLPLLFTLPTILIPLLVILRNRGASCMNLAGLVLLGFTWAIAPTLLASLLFLGGVGRVWTGNGLRFYLADSAGGTATAIGFVVCQRCARGRGGRGFPVSERREVDAWE